MFDTFLLITFGATVLIIFGYFTGCMILYWSCCASSLSSKMSTWNQAAVERGGGRGRPSDSRSLDRSNTLDDIPSLMDDTIHFESEIVHKQRTPPTRRHSAETRAADESIDDTDRLTGSMASSMDEIAGVHESYSQADSESDSRRSSRRRKANPGYAETNL